VAFQKVQTAMTQTETEIVRGIGEDYAAHGEVLSIAFAGAGQHQDAGGKVVHVAPETTSLITSKSISKMSRGLSESEASAMIVAGFVEPIVKELPLEYAIEMNRLFQIQMEGSVG
jgi:Fe-S cluster assembly scaffold protein SufB